MSEGGWQDAMRAQQEELLRLEQMNAALDAGQSNLGADITRALRKTSFRSTTPRLNSANKASRTVTPTSANKASRAQDDVMDDFLVDGTTGEDDENDVVREIDIASVNIARNNRNAAVANGMNDHILDSPDIDPSKAPETAAKFQKARLKVLEKQLDDNKQMRGQLLEQVHDLQRQLTNERDENKKLKKRVQLLEIDSKRSATSSRSESAATTTTASVQDLQAEIATLKKDLQTAERLAKQAEATNKSKDVQLKRATEAVNRLRAENEELTSQVQAGSTGDRTKLDEMVARVRNLEKQRSDLIDAFRKQMKLIDVLKRQKSHIEAARLLSFSEEEFLKTLDWAL